MFTEHLLCANHNCECWAHSSGDQCKSLSSDMPLGEEKQKFQMNSVCTVLTVTTMFSLDAIFKNI